MQKWIKILSAVTLFACFASSSFAAVPQRLNFQAILLEEDGTVVPDGAYELTFRIFADSIGGVALWEETQTLNTESGLFNTFLGRTSALTDEVFDGPRRFMEMHLVGSPDPYVPRTAIGSVAYAYRVSTVDGATGGMILGDVTLEGTLGPIATLETDVDGTGGFLAVYRNGEAAGFVVDGNSDGSGEPEVAIMGSTQIALFDMSAAGDQTVVLPGSAIAAPEIFDEPGIAQGQLSGEVEVSGATSMIDIVTCTLTIPAPGYIMIEAAAQPRFYETGVNHGNYMECQIDETAGGGMDVNHSFRVGFASAPAVSNTWWPVSMKRTYFKAIAGEYVFRFEALDGTGEGQKFMWNPVITATYFPTSYGAVTSFVSSAEAAQFPGAVLETALGDNVETTGAARSTYRVDLRELEQQVAEAQEALRRAESELRRAVLDAQNTVRPVGE